MVTAQSISAMAMTISLSVIGNAYQPAMRHDFTIVEIAYQKFGTLAVFYEHF